MLKQGFNNFREAKKLQKKLISPKGQDKEKGEEVLEGRAINSGQKYG